MEYFCGLDVATVETAVCVVERHYRSGKVVLVKGHHRGHEAAQELPIRVMGPRLEMTRFEFSATQPKNRD
ncbi:hypothetical protein RHI9324_04304 [Rhizobium sp. CECT 9324]|nr:hypothetical protein RHI9324_04304 [Rhizobium sp. CECT 9324]